jgi:uncharacterized protein (TIGR02246 family)
MSGAPADHHSNFKASKEVTDEQQIRDLVKTWLAATKSGDIDTVLGSMTDDVLFLLPGRQPMTKSEFAAASRPQRGEGKPIIDGTSNILEVTVVGELAYIVSQLSIKVTPPGGGPFMERAGHTMSILKKVDGRWLLARDANLLVSVKRAEAAN